MQKNKNAKDDCENSNCVLVKHDGDCEERVKKEIITKNDNTGDEVEPNHNKEGGRAMIDAMIEELSWTGPGEGYSAKGKRNPIRDDTQDQLTLATMLSRPKRILELGTAFGLSGLCLLRGMPLAELVTLEFGEDAAKKAQENFDAAGVNAKVIIGDAGKTIVDKLTGHFDVVFIDHEKKSYLPHFLALLEQGVIGHGTIILADNVNDRRAECVDFVWHMEAMFPTTTILETECGLLVARV